MAAPDRAAPPEGDWIEESGTWIGRALGPVILLLCVLWLLFRLGGGS